MNTYDLLFVNDKNKEIYNNIIESYFLDGETESITYLPKFNKINIIVGANNSGKSRFMRYLMTYNNLNGMNDFQKINDLISYYN